MLRSILFSLFLRVLPALLPLLATAPATAHDRAACPRVFAPVCAVRTVRLPHGTFRQRRTYPNACVAHAQGARVIHSGPCRRVPPTGVRPAATCMVWHDGCNTCRRLYPGGPWRCTRRHCVRFARPRCLSRFANQPRPRPPRACPQIYRPVCARVQVRCVRAPCRPVRRTFSNACFARAAGARIIHFGRCR